MPNQTNDLRPSGKYASHFAITVLEELGYSLFFFLHIPVLCLFLSFAFSDNAELNWSLSLAPSALVFRLRGRDRERDREFDLERVFFLGFTALVSFTTLATTSFTLDVFDLVSVLLGVFDLDLLCEREEDLELDLALRFDLFPFVAPSSISTGSTKFKLVSDDVRDGGRCGSVKKKIQLILSHLPLGLLHYYVKQFMAI